MQKALFKDFRIVPDFNSVHREAISDEEYFSAKYAKCISNSRLKWIDPTDGGNPELFKSPPRFSNTSLSRGR